MVCDRRMRLRKCPVQLVRGQLGEDHCRGVVVRRGARGSGGGRRVERPLQEVNVCADGVGVRGGTVFGGCLLG